MTVTNTVGVIYLVNDKICYRSYTGSCITASKTRWGNHKSHIKSNYLDCELAQHVAEREETYILDRSPGAHKYYHAGF